MTTCEFRRLVSCVVRICLADGWHPDTIAADLDWVKNQLLRDDEE